MSPTYQLNPDKKFKRTERGLYIEPGIAINGSGALIIDQLQAGKTVQDIAAHLAASYEIDVAAAQADTQAFVSGLVSEDILRERR